MIKKIKRLFAVSLLLCAAFCTMGCKSKKSKGAKSMPQLTIESVVSYSTPSREKIWFATSTQPQASITIEPRVAGYLNSIDFEGGSYVEKGSRLFRIDPSQINTTLYSAMASVESAEAQLVEAKNNYERAIPLSKINAISQSTLDSYTASYAAARATVKSAKEQLRSAELDVSYTCIYSPMSGTISKSPASVGDYVGVGTKFSTLTTISAIDTIEVDLTIPLSKYLKYTPLNSSPRDEELLSEITLILPDSSLFPSRGEYSYTKSDAADGSSTVVIVAKFANPEGVLKPNMFARVSADIGESKERVMIPGQAVMQMQGVNSVWVIKPDTTVTLRRVTLASSLGLEWAVESGVESGERVATTGLLKLHEGQKVKLQQRK